MWVHALIVVWETWVWFLKCLPHLYHLMNLRALEDFIEFRHRWSLNSYTGKSWFFLSLHSNPSVRPKNLQNLSDLHDNFWFNVIWRRWYAAVFGLRWFDIDCLWSDLLCVGRLAESDVTVMPLVTSLDWLCSWYCTADVVPPLITMDFVTKWVRNTNVHHLVQRKWKIGERSHYWREVRHNKLTGKRWTNFWHVVRLELLIVSVVTPCDNAVRITESVPEKSV